VADSKERRGRALLDKEQKLEAMNEMLRIAARDNNVLRRDTFQALAAALAKYVPLDCMAVVVPEPGGKRLYAASVPESNTPVPPFGARFPHGPQEETVLNLGTTKICDDTRNAETLDQIAVQWGFLSYVILPIWQPLGPRAPTSGSTKDRIVAKLVVAFRETGCASATPIDLLKLLAELFGDSFERALEVGREHRLAMILETSGDSMIAWDREGKITDANAAAATLTGIPREELLAMSIHELLDRRAIEEGASGNTHALRTTLTRRRPDDPTQRESIAVSVTINSVDDDPLVSLHALIRDESHVVAKEREAAAHFARVQELEKEMRAILDNAPLIIFRLDAAKGQLKYLNRHAERLLGVPTADALRTPDFLRAVHQGPEAMLAFDTAVANAREGKTSPPYEARLRWDGGAEIAVRGTIYPLLGVGGDVIAIEGILADVSAEHAARAQAIQTDRLSSLGMLAASVAHEINNPAAFILLGLGTLEKMLNALVPAGEEGIAAVGELLRELRDSINRIVRIARDLRVFASPSRGQLQGAITDVNEVVESALSLTRGKLVEHARLEKELTDVPPVFVDAGRLGQVIVNLLLNATQALPKTPSRTATIRVATRVGGGNVEIEVTDSGVGIPEDNLHRIWAPFFTTKASDMGTGLGLSISREIVERAGGTIRVESPAYSDEEGARGSRFVVALPMADDAMRLISLGAAPPSSPEPIRVVPRKRVLVVEDELPLARVLSLELGRAHDVTVVHDAETAWELLLDRRFDVVLCDLRMPGMSGETFYAKVKDRDPAQAEAFIFMSGIGFVPEVELFLAATGRPVLQKPFSPADVLEAIAQVDEDDVSRST
jgi:PAS domain S-box-containing protein